MPLDFSLWANIEKRMAEAAPKGKESQGSFKARLRRVALRTPMAIVRAAVALAGEADLGGQGAGHRQGLRLARSLERLVAARFSLPVSISIFLSCCRPVLSPSLDFYLSGASLVAQTAAGARTRAAKMRTSSGLHSTLSARSMHAQCTLMARINARIQINGKTRSSVGESKNMYMYIFLCLLLTCLFRGVICKRALMRAMSVH